MRILVALSGGIDSSVVAHMLAAQGHDLVGVRFTLWSDPLAPALASVLPSKCCNAQTAARAAAVCTKLRIPYHIVNLEEIFKEEVVDPFLEGYRKGLTPNPCIRCNRTIKFGTLLRLMEEFGCEKLATGHYARVAVEETSGGQKRFLLLEAADASKDQSYYLYGLSQQQLQHALFPLGAMAKREVFALAENFGVPYERLHYRESQDLCFFPEKSPQAFLKRHLQSALVPGKIVRRNGTILGTHAGLPLYTIGQRHGLGIGGLKIPLEVVEKDQSKNTLIVANKGEEKVKQVKLKALRFVAWKPEEGKKHPFEARSRSLSLRVQGDLEFRRTRGTFSFHRSTGPQAPGQSLVLYRGEEVVGGGVICV
jgi:tRNA-specific 2-thiouridylase